MMINNIVVCLLAVVIVWLVATSLFIYGNTILGKNFWRAFIWAIPFSALAILRMGREWVPLLVKTIIWSVFLWTFITAVVLSFLKYNLWMFYVVGAPAQIIVILIYLQRISK